MLRHDTDERRGTVGQELLAQSITSDVGAERPSRSPGPSHLPQHLGRAGQEIGKSGHAADEPDRPAVAPIRRRFRRRPGPEPPKNRPAPFRATEHIEREGVCGRRQTKHDHVKDDEVLRVVDHRPGVAVAQHEEQEARKERAHDPETEPRNERHVEGYRDAENRPKESGADGAIEKSRHPHRLEEALARAGDPDEHGVALPHIPQGVPADEDPKQGEPRRRRGAEPEPLEPAPPLAHGSLPPSAGG